MKDQHRAFHRLTPYIKFQGSKVLEVGGSVTFESTEPFIDISSEIFVTGLDHFDRIGDVTFDKRIQALRLDGRNLSSHFSPNTFDVIYGLSVIEHIQEPKVFLSNVYSILKPGGIAYFDGSPFFSSDIGHHLWIMDWEYGLTTSYSFSPLPGGSANPIPPWGHLYMDEGELLEYLTSRDVPKRDSQLICKCVHENQHINRLTALEIAEAYTKSGLIVREAVMMYSHPSAEILNMLMKRFESDPGFGIRGGYYILQKPY